MISKLRERIGNVARREEGFTLIELMIVIAVLGILAGIAIPKITGVKDDAEIAAAKSNLRTFQSGLEMYYASSEDSTYPADLTNTRLENYVSDNLITTVGTDSYGYKSNDTNTEYIIQYKTADDKYYYASSDSDVGSNLDSNTGDDTAPDFNP